MQKKIAFAKFQISVLRQYRCPVQSDGGNRRRIHLGRGSFSTVQSYQENVVSWCLSANCLNSSLSASMAMRYSSGNRGYALDGTVIGATISLFTLAWTMMSCRCSSSFRISSRNVLSAAQLKWILRARSEPGNASMAYQVVNLAHPPGKRTQRKIEKDRKAHPCPILRTPHLGLEFSPPIS